MHLEGVWKIKHPLRWTLFKGAMLVGGRVCVCQPQHFQATWALLSPRLGRTSSGSCAWPNTVSRVPNRLPRVFYFSNQAKDSQRNIRSGEGVKAIPCARKESRNSLAICLIVFDHYERLNISPISVRGSEQITETAAKHLCPSERPKAGSELQVEEANSPHKGFRKPKRISGSQQETDKGTGKPTTLILPVSKDLFTC